MLVVASKMTWVTIPLWIANQYKETIVLVRFKIHMLRSIILLCIFSLLMAGAWVYLNPEHLKDPVQYLTTQGIRNWLNNLGSNMILCYWISIVRGLDCSKGGE